MCQDAPPLLLLLLIIIILKIVPSQYQYYTNTNTAAAATATIILAAVGCCRGAVGVQQYYWAYCGENIEREECWAVGERVAWHTRCSFSKESHRLGAEGLTSPHQCVGSLVRWYVGTLVRLYGCASLGLVMHRCNSECTHRCDDVVAQFE